MAPPDHKPLSSCFLSLQVEHSPTAGSIDSQQREANSAPTLPEVYAFRIWNFGNCRPRFVGRARVSLFPFFLHRFILGLVSYALLSEHNRPSSGGPQVN